jgi:chromosome partitioning protein
MYDSRLRLSTSGREVQKHFNDMVFDTIIQRNVSWRNQVLAGIINYDTH